MGDVLLSFQSAVMSQPGLNTVRLQDDVPYHAMQCSINATVTPHIDKADLLGGVISWMTFDHGVSGGAFVLYSLGVKVQIQHLTHVWLRSDRVVHGTVRSPHATPAGSIILGMALFNKGHELQQVCKVYNQGGAQHMGGPLQGNCAVCPQQAVYQELMRMRLVPLSCNWQLCPAKS